MNWRGYGRKRSWSNIKVLSRMLSGGIEEDDENFSQYSQFLGRNFNPGRPEYEAELLTTRPLRSVKIYHECKKKYVGVSLLLALKCKLCCLFVCFRTNGMHCHLYRVHG
jgi:hypothetical protein